MLHRNLDKKDILKAIKEIDVNGIPLDHHSTKWSVKYDNKYYPPNI